MSEFLVDANDKNSWVFIESKKEDEEDFTSKSIIETASKVENVKDRNIEHHIDSDTDSISVISESSCSCKTDEEDIQETRPTDIGNDIQNDTREIVQSPLSDLIISEPPRSQILTGRFFSFGTSTICVFAIIGLGIAVQHYLTSVTEELDNFYYEDLRSTFNIDKDSVTKTKSYAENYEKKPVYYKSNNYIINEYQEKRKKRYENENYQIKCDKFLKSNKFYLQGSNTDSSENYEKKKIRSDESYEDRIKKLKIKEEYLTKKEKFLIEKENDLIKQEMQLNTEKLYDKSFQFTETKEHKKKQKHEQKLFSKGEKNRFFEKSKHFEHKPKRTKNDKTTKEKPGKNDFNEKRKKTNYNIDLKIKKNENIVSNKNSKYQNSLKKRNVTGDWYINLHKARLNIREKEKASDWVFDRAYIRNIKRNKAYWYFQWMIDRDRLRIK